VAARRRRAGPVGPVGRARRHGHVVARDGEGADRAGPGPRRGPRQPARAGDGAGVRVEARRGLPLAILFAAGLAAGIWIFVSPWALAYPAPRAWTSSIWTSVWVGGIVTAASGVSLVAVL